MGRFIGNVRILFVARTLVVLGAVRLPVADAHPAEIVLTVEALHVIAAAVLLDADVAFRAVFGVRTDVVGRFAVVGALGQPTFDHLAVGRCMVVGAAFETERRVARRANGLLRCDVARLNDDLAVRSRTETQFRMGFDVVEEGKLLVAIAHHWLREEIQDEFFGDANIALGGHAAHGR